MNICIKWIKILGFSTIITFCLLNFKVAKAGINTSDTITWEKHSKSNTYYIVDGIKYFYDINGEYARIVDVYPVEGTEKIEVLNIPEELNGYTVVAIGLEGSRGSESYPFDILAKGLKEIIVPDTVTDLYFGAFSQLRDLERIVLPNHLKVLPDSIFSDCEILNEIILPERLEKIGEFAFAYTGLTSIYIPSSVKSIGKGAFLNCKKLIKVELPKNIKKISQSLFARCIELKEINLENITYFDENSLYGCTKLKIINFNKNISYIGWSAFKETKWLKEQESKSFVIINKKYLVQYNGKSTKPIIPKGITHIFAGTFNDKKLTSIEIPNTVTFIEASFRDTGIKSIYFAGNAPKIKVKENETISSYLGRNTKIYYKKGKTGFNTKKWKELNPKTYTKYQ